MKTKDTIVSLASPSGVSAVSVIRCSGPNVQTIIKRFFKKDLEDRVATYIDFIDKKNVIDDVIAILYKGPRSFTGEDMLEILCHGGPVIYQTIISSIASIEEAREAEPGEFSERAFINGKIDLPQAEAICSIINSETIEAANAARKALSGGFSEEVISIDKKVLNIRVEIEALLDFPDEEIEHAGLEDLDGLIKTAIASLDELIEKTIARCVLSDGVRAAILGRPNAGKSSLFNLLLGNDASIVNKQQGTTRDVVFASLNLDGAPIFLYDTAGIRKTTDPIEIEGCRRSYITAENADLIIYLFDGEEGETLEDKEVVEKIKNMKKPILLVTNKIDLRERKENQGEIEISAKENIGIDLLKKKISEEIALMGRNSSVSVIKNRQLTLLREAKDNILALNISLNELDLAAEQLKRTQECLVKILGEEEEDRVLSGIFSSFCIGK